MDTAPQLFDTSPFTAQQRPPTHSESMTAPRDSRTPQQRKRDANRDRITSSSPGSASRYRDIIEGDEDAVDPTSHVTDYGIPFRGTAHMLTKLTPFDNSAFRRHGHYAEMPVVGAGNEREDELFNTPHGPRLGAAQSEVNTLRTTELAHNPELGKDPRFPSDLPLVADVRYPRRGGNDVWAPVIHNGTHRVMAAVERGEMFTPVQHIDRAHIPAAVAEARYSRELYEGPRAMNADLAYRRMSSGDATEGKGEMSGGGSWGLR